MMSSRNYFIIVFTAILLLACNPFAEAYSQKVINYFGQKRLKVAENLYFFLEPQEVPDTNSVNVFFIKEGRLGFSHGSLDKKESDLNEQMVSAGAHKARLKSTVILEEFNHIKAIDYVMDYIDENHLIAMQLQGELNYRMEIYQLKRKRGAKPKPSPAGGEDK